MSQEIVLVAILNLTPGKWERMDDLFANALKYMQDNEPGTLEFRVFKEANDSSRGVLVERYTSQDALEHHRSSQSYQHFFQKMQEEEILSGPPEIITGKYLYGFWRR